MKSSISTSVSLLLHDLTTALMSAPTPPIAVATEPNEARPVRERDPHQEHGNIFPYVDYWNVSGR